MSDANKYSGTTLVENVKDDSKSSDYSLDKPEETNKIFKKKKKKKTRKGGGR